MDFTFSDFVDIEFPIDKNIVYILYFKKNKVGQEIPFYVGMSSKGIGRIGDYISGKFSAPTDFKVGEAILYLQELGLNIRLKYKSSENRKCLEKEIIDFMKKNKKFQLLNDFKGYNYKKSTESNERQKIRDFIDTWFIESVIHE